MIKCCIFDLDGTLLNTLGTIRYYMNQTLTGQGIAPVTEEECRSFVGSGARQLMHRACLSRGVEDASLEELMLTEYMAAYDNGPYHLTEKYGGIDELIGTLKARGIKLAVLSNKPDFATRMAVAHFFCNSFDAVHGGRDNIPLKPAADGCAEILSELGLSPNEAVYIGDSDVDFFTGENMGAAVNISVLWGFRTQEQLLKAGAHTFAYKVPDIINIIDGV